jgi:hypothetical protein
LSIDEQTERILEKCLGAGSLAQGKNSTTRKYSLKKDSHEGWIIYYFIPSVPVLSENDKPRSGHYGLGGAFFV